MCIYQPCQRNIAKGEFSDVATHLLNRNNDLILLNMLLKIT